MNVSDIVILAVLAVGIVAGIIAGFAKLLNGTIGGIIAFIAAICLGIFLAGYLAGVSAFVDLQTKISDFFVSKFDVAGYKAKVSDGELFLNVSGSAWTSVSTLFEGSSKLKIALLVQTVCVKLFQRRAHGQRYPCGICGKPYRESPLRHYRFSSRRLSCLKFCFRFFQKLLSKIVEKNTKRIPQR
ncbi:MAG: CvpA family protein [Clostridiales bacterium]|nr:MAG: CvpA family protein [Clostridiales bacterium]